MRGRRITDEEFDWSSVPIKKIAIIALIVIIVIGVIVFSVYTLKKRKEVQSTDIGDEAQGSQMLQDIDGYEVLGQIVIEKIGLEQYILNSSESKALEKGAVKLYGDELNKEGNFCIAGHNYEEIFADLQKLQVGDEFYIADKEDIIQDYEITEITEVDATDLTPLMPVSDKIQVTLITCKENSNKRLVIKAERINIEG